MATKPKPIEFKATSGVDTGRVQQNRGTFSVFVDNPFKGPGVPADEICCYRETLRPMIEALERLDREWVEMDTE